jgi:protein TonB
MNYAQRQADPRRHLIGFTIVVLFHVFLFYALVSGLAKRVVDVVRAPIETKVIEEVKKPPPPPELELPPPPKLDAPPPPYIPPPEIQIAAPVTLAPTITATTSTPPPPQNIAPVRPVAVAPPAPAVVSAAVVCSNYATAMGDTAFPREAIRAGIERGDALVRFTLTAGGEVKDIQVVRASHPIFGRQSVRIVGEFKCHGQGHDVVVQVPFGYKME